MNNIFNYVNHEIYIVTSKDDQQINGQVATWIMKASLSPEPVRLLMLISPLNHSYQLIKRSGLAAIQMLSEEQHELVSLFGLQSGKDINKFAGLKLKYSNQGLPLLQNSCGWVECKILHNEDYGDRHALLLEVIDSQTNLGKKPLRKNELIEKVDRETQALLESKMFNDGKRDKELLRFDFNN